MNLISMKGFQIIYPENSTLKIMNKIIINIMKKNLVYIHYYLIVFINDFIFYY